jgi:general secretion pathway protein A
MYQNYFRLTRHPFSLALEPDLLLATAAHKEAVATLAYAITAKKGFVLLTGEVGTGKSTVIRSVLRTLVSTYGDAFRFCIIVNPRLSTDDLLDFVLSSFGERDLPAEKSQRLMRFQQLLLHARKAGQICALVIDEAQQMPPDVLEEIRLWTNFETFECKLLQIILAGQTELDDILNQPELRQLKQRVAFRATLSHLAPADVRTYIDHRWTRCGGQLPAPFTPDAIQTIAYWSGGIPRLINVLCDNALLSAFAMATREVTAREVNEAAMDLNLRQSGSPPVEPEDTTGTFPTEAPPDKRIESGPEPALAQRAVAASNGHTPTFAAVEDNNVLRRWALRLRLGRSK